MKEKIEGRKLKCVQDKTTSQPSIYHVSEGNDHSYYLQVDSIAYSCRSSLKVVDAAIKTHMALNLKYSSEATHPYTFLQRFGYNIRTRFDKITPAVSILLKTLTVEM
jgi:hypothetical protein